TLGLTQAIALDRPLRKIDIHLSHFIERVLHFIRAIHGEIDSTPAMACPAIHPVVHAAWKLKPPVMPSMSSSSPAKYRPGQMRLSIVLKFTSDRRTPPHVTNSSLLRLLPVTWSCVW